MVDLAGAEFVKSSRSDDNGNANCVEVARNLPDVVAFRDSKNPVDAFAAPRSAFAGFIADVKTGRFDLQ